MVKILIEPSGHYFYNLGDLAMLMTTIERIQNRVPDAQVFLLTHDPEACKQLFPHITPILLGGSHIWDSLSFTQLYRWLPDGVSKRLAKWQYQLKKRFPKLTYHLFRLRARLGNHTGKNDDLLKYLDAFFDSFIQADMYVISGQGGLNDEFGFNTVRYLNLIDQFKHRRKAVAMFGQGLGPINNPTLLSQAHENLKKVDIISLREKLHGEPLLHAFDIDPHRIFVTGDDALELAYRAQKPELGNGIGINIRVAYYSRITTDTASALQQVLCDFSHRMNAPLLPVPINTGYDVTDMQAVQQVLAHCPISTDELDKVYSLPSHVIEQVSRCRVVITGSYHAAVFALGQGIPVIGLAANDYYSYKFLGLQDLFGIGCEVILLHGKSSPERLSWAMRYLWEQADQIRPLLLERARLQIRASQDVYTSAFGMPINPLS